ncbi:MAG: transposase [Cupriavidus necator]
MNQMLEAVFANLRHDKRLDRLTLRTAPKVSTQWTLYCLVHNIEKLAHHGYAQEARGWPARRAESRL